MRFRALDSFRGLCALLVCLYHFPIASHLMAPDFFIPNAPLLLDFFFVLSGFIIASSYGDKLKRWSDFGTFATRRFARLWPLHAVVLGAFVLIELAKLLLAPHVGATPPFTDRNAPAGILTSLLMIHSLHVHPMLVWNAPSWTVSVEFYTYLVYGALVVGWPRRPVLGAVLMAAVGAFGLIVVAGQIAPNYDYGIFRCLYGFFCGVLVWRLWRAGAVPLHLGPRLATLAEIVVTVGVFAFMAFWGAPPLGFAGPLVFSIFIVVYASERGHLTRLLRWRPLVRLGEISYSIYLIHFLIVVCMGLALKSLARVGHVDLAPFGVSGLDDALVHVRSAWTMDAISGLYLVAVILIAGQTHRFVEEPGRRALSHLRLWPLRQERALPSLET